VIGTEWWKNGYYPVVAFRARDGREVRFRDKVGLPRIGQGKSASISVGGPVEGVKVDVVYDPAEPERARVATAMRLWGLPAGIIGLGALILVLLILVTLNGGLLGS